jgi:27-O-demethylrifamycin SV methyltransferase
MTYEPAAHYDRVTAAWTLLLGDELHYGVFADPGEPLAAATARLTALMAAAARVAAGSRVLDVGCGTGAPACRLAAETGAHVTGITTSAVGVEAARARARAAGVADRVAFDVRDGMANGYPDGAFDRVLVLESSHLMRDRAALVAECARVLVPGGRLALCDIMLARPLSFAEVRAARGPLGLLREVFGDARMEPAGEYRRRFADAGLTVDGERDLTAAVRPTFAHWRENAARHRDPVAATLGREGLERFVEACGVLETLWDDGVLGYGLLSAVR